MFNSIVINKAEGDYQVIQTQLTEDNLIPHQVTVAVEYSTLNYKDALAITGKAPIIRSFPRVPGIDFAGRVTASESEKFTPGDTVVLNGFGVGESEHGGMSQLAKAKPEWLVKLPAEISPLMAMQIGTAGYTAMLCVMAIQNHGVKPEDGEVLVTGVTGGVGSFAAMLLNKLGYTVVGSSGSTDSDHLSKLGVTDIIPRATLAEAGKPLQKERWAAVVDSLGGNSLANACASTKYSGIVAACGLAESMALPATVAPFILRGVTLAGIDSVMCPIQKRQQAWQQLAELLNENDVNQVTRIIGLGDVIDSAKQLLAGDVSGRLVVDVNR